jgi:hypothetical protein
MKSYGICNISWMQNSVRPCGTFVFALGEAAKAPRIVDAINTVWILHSSRAATPFRMTSLDVRPHEQWDRPKPA